jgi:hypothetical protein
MSFLVTAWLALAPRPSVDPWDKPGGRAETRKGLSLVFGWHQLLLSLQFSVFSVLSSHRLI